MAAARTDGTPEAPIRIAVSACLVGDEVRYDGDHARHRYVADRLARAFALVPECPEVGIGLGTPRPKIRLEEARGDDAATEIRLRSEHGRDLTETMRSWSAAAAARFEAAGVAGVVLKSRSPSCGLGDAKVRAEGRPPQPIGTGLFAEVLARAMPGVPLIAETGLDDPARRDHWLTRVFALGEFRALERENPNMNAIQGFHARWKSALLAHSETAARHLGRMLAAARDVAATLPGYRRVMLAGFAQAASTGSHRNVLEHLAGHLRAPCPPDERRAVRRAIDAFSGGRAPLRIPASAIAEAAARHGVRTLLDQAYLADRPAVLGYRDADPARPAAGAASTRS